MKILIYFVFCKYACKTLNIATKIREREEKTENHLQSERIKNRMGETLNKRIWKKQRKKETKNGTNKMHGKNK